AKLAADRSAPLYGTHSAPSPGGETSGARPGGTAHLSIVFPRPRGGGVCPCILLLGGFFPWQRLGDSSVGRHRASRSTDGLGGVIGPGCVIGDVQGQMARVPYPADYFFYGAGP